MLQDRVYSHSMVATNVDSIQTKAPILAAISGIAPGYFESLVRTKNSANSRDR